MPRGDACPVELPPYGVEMMASGARYNVPWGGRGSAKTTTIARILIAEAMTSRHTVGCFREFQNSMKDSVHQVLQRNIEALGLNPWFSVTDDAIRCPLTKSVFIFKGLHNNVLEVKGMEGLTRAWVEEAQSCSKLSLQILGPTVRAPGSRIYLSFNQMDAGDPVWQEFVVKQREDAWVRPVTYEDNPWFGETELEGERLQCLKTNPDDYDWIWGRELRRIGEAAIFRGKVDVAEFPEPPDGTRFFYGADWGFANDPSFAVRLWVDGDDLVIDHESVGYGTELEDLAVLLKGGKASDGRVYPGLPGVERWPVKADGSRPETISFVRRKGFNMTAAEKWPGSVEDGIEHLKAFRRIRVHARCRHMAREARLYGYKVDKRSGDILPVIEDRDNHGWDATRYALDGYIQKRGKTRWHALKL